MMGVLSHFHIILLQPLLDAFVAIVQALINRHLYDPSFNQMSTKVLTLNTPKWFDFKCLEQRHMAKVEGIPCT
jgi:hypothetical protein